MPSEAVDVDRGQFVGRRLSHVAFVVDLHELSPVGRWATGGRDGRWFERFAKVCQGLTLRGRRHPGLRPLANLRFEVSRLLPAVCSEPNVTAAVRALKGKLLPHLQYAVVLSHRADERTAFLDRDGERFFRRRYPCTRGRTCAGSTPSCTSTRSLAPWSGRSATASSDVSARDGHAACGWRLQ